MELELLLSRIKAYFLYLGINEKELGFININTFNAGCEIKLPKVCIVAKNRDSVSHQSHIHVTGENMKIFFSPTQLKEYQTIDYSNQAAVLSCFNIAKINKKTVDTNSLLLVNTFVRTKLAMRKDESAQVQLGETRKDSSYFNELRDGLYEGDYLLILKYASEDKLFIVGIPNDYNASIEAEKKSKEYESISYENNTYSCESELDDAIYQNEIQNVQDSPISVINKTPVEFDATTMADRKSHRPLTDAKLAKQVLKRAGYKCIFDTEKSHHETFIALTGHPYLEAHHLIPLSAQSYFKNKLDTYSNIIPLCPNCHRMIHYGNKEKVSEMITELYKARESDLRYSIKEDLTLEEIVKYYK